jgi:CRP/FNR family transcriptional regulator, dissimilatory nitrate respiration regulator
LTPVKPRGPQLGHIVAMPSQDRSPQAVLAALPLFAAAPAGTLARLAAQAERRELAAGQVLFDTGDAIDGLYVSVSGDVQLLETTPSERLAALAGAGQALCEPALFLGSSAPHRARALTACRLLRVPKAALFAELEQDPRLARALIGGLSARVDALHRELQQHSRAGARARLVDYLMQQAGATEGPACFMLRAPKSSIAAQLHITPEHLSRLLRDLSDSRLLTVERQRITIPDLARMAAHGAARTSP